MKIQPFGLVKLFVLVTLSTMVMISHTRADVKLDIRGKVTQIEERKDGSFRLLIEGKKTNDTNYDKAWVNFTDKTKIEKIVDGERKPATLNDLKKKGIHVEMTFDGPVAESYPVQAKAGYVLILPSVDKK